MLNEGLQRNFSAESSLLKVYLSSGEHGDVPCCLESTSYEGMKRDSVDNGVKLKCPLNLREGKRASARYTLRRLESAAKFFLAAMLVKGKLA